MDVNLSKTKITIFNKKYQIKLENPKFCYFRKEIDETNTYNVLGITFSNDTNRFATNTQRLRDKTVRAIYSARKLATDKIGNNIPIPVLLKIFDSQIQPILDYGSEIWYQGKSTSQLETQYLSYLKKVLRVKKQTSTLAVYGEFGRCPLEIRQKELLLK